MVNKPSRDGLMYDIGWEGWHENCLCPQRRETMERNYIMMNPEYAAVIAQCVANGQIGVADRMIDAWIAVNISMDAKWKWGRKFNTISFSPKSGKATNASVNEGFYRDLVDVWVPWCANTSYRIIMRERMIRRAQASVDWVDSTESAEG